MLGMAQRGAMTAAAPALPNARPDIRDIASTETTVSVSVLDNDDNVEGATVTIPSPAVGADAIVLGQNINVSRIGTSAGNYSLTYRATTAVGSSQATLSGSIAAVPTNGGSVGPIEPVNGSLLQVAISVNTTTRQSWIGFGFGLNNHSGASAGFNQAQTHVTKLCEDLNSTVIRGFTPENSSAFLTAYKPYWDLMRNHGVDRVFTSSYIHTTANQNSTTPNATGMANGISAVIAAGMPIHAVSMQNEPDGSTINRVPGAGSTQVNSGNADAVAGYYTTLRNRLTALGRQSVVILSHEWRHPTTHGPTEFDLMDARGLFSNVIDGLCLHIYDKSPDNVLYDNRYLIKGQHVWSTETGNNGSPNCQARFLAGVNHGSVVEIVHIGIISAYSTDPVKKAEQQNQLLLDPGGTKRPWYGACQVISTNLVRGTVIRRCQSSDRPSGLNTTHADRMIRQPGASGGRNPRQQVIAGKRADGRWVVAAVNTTHDTDSFNTFTGGHYGAVTQQLTVTIPELSGLDRAFSAKRANINGSVTGPATVNLKNGVMRFTLAPGETIGMTST